MRIEVVPAAEMGGEAEAAWRRFQADDETLHSPFLCCPFVRRTAAVRGDVFVGVLSEGGEVVGFFPFQRAAGGTGSPVAAGVGDYHGLVLARGAEPDARELLAGCGLVSWSFDHLIAAQKTFEPFHRELDGSPVIDLAGGFAAYEASFRGTGSRLLRKTRAQLRRLRADVDGLRFEPRVTDPALLGELIAWKRDQRRRTGTRDCFDEAWVLELVEGLPLAAHEDGFGGRLTALLAGAEPIALELYLTSPWVWHAWFTAYDRRFHRYSPGVVLSLLAARTAAEEGVSYVDMGKKTSLLKERLRTRSIAVAAGRVELGD